MTSHNPLFGALWMVLAGLAFALTNTIAQYGSINAHIDSTMFALIQYIVAFLVMLPWLMKIGIVESLKTQQFGVHCFRVLLSVIGIQLWLWSLAHPLPIWQSIAILMTSPFFVLMGSSFFLKEEVGGLRWIATVVGFIGALIILEPWGDQFEWFSLMPLGAAFFWAGYSLVVKKQAETESPSSIIMYLFILILPFNAFIALPNFGFEFDSSGWYFLVGAGVLTGLAQYAIVKAYSCADASYIQPFDHFKLPLNVFLGWYFLGWVPPGKLWIGAVLIIGSVLYITYSETKGKKA